MGVITSIKSVLGVAPETANAYECHNCGHEFESRRSRDSALLSCPECRSDAIVHRDGAEA